MTMNFAGTCPACGGKLFSISIGWRCGKCGGFVDMKRNFHRKINEPFIPPEISTSCDGCLYEDDSYTADPCCQCTRNPDVGDKFETNEETKKSQH